ncbi:PEP-CTERM sorting domain-containing protein [Sabulicella rubraurantiaca]|uniref:PEP-CTERM sorting domain-containing protein n=1 Tax=Sabulicella rubraurantiaca TaxID=2811429 RepID=UPI001A9633A0|nr:PEP-CTERM sorting domain-containing protein [Sabulicella rubraurantiaca]
MTAFWRLAATMTLSYLAAFCGRLEADAALLPPDITNTNQAIVVLEGTGPHKLIFNIRNPSTDTAATFAGVLRFQETFIGGDPNDVPQNLRIGGGTCFANFPGGAGVKLQPGGACTLEFPFTTRLLPVENMDEGTVRLQFFTAFQENVTATTTAGFGFITVRDPGAVNLPEPGSAALLIVGLLGLAAARRRHMHSISLRSHS